MNPVIIGTIANLKIASLMSYIQKKTRVITACAKGHCLPKTKPLINRRCWLRMGVAIGARFMSASHIIALNGKRGTIMDQWIEVQAQKAHKHFAKLGYVEYSMDACRAYVTSFAKDQLLRHFLEGIFCDNSRKE